MKGLDAILAGHPFCKGLDPGHLALVTGCAANVRFKAGEYLFREGEESSRLFIVRSGRVALEIYAAERGAITIQTVSEGEIIGWSWLVPPYQWRFDARAVEATAAIALDGACLRTKCEKDHSFGYEMLKRLSNTIAQRLEATRLQLLDMYGTHH
ncbi:MAG: Crp/Fnr family transcriptional regulator [Planctomycetes bacterium RBG_16_59_8]|nr:MAG: Crp/Fnr family transcriptional regulator [Planctomycetes bacterium RBG_16_59_8]